MANRNILHRSKLEDFTTWLKDNGYHPVKNNAQFEVLRWKVKGQTMPILFDGKSSEHFSCNEASTPFVLSYIESLVKPEEPKSFDSAFELLTCGTNQVENYTMRSNMMNAVNDLVFTKRWSQKDAAEH